MDEVKEENNNSMTTEKNPIPRECSIILGVSTLLSSPNELESSTILPLEECLRRLNEMKPGSLKQTKFENQAIGEFDGDVGSLLHVFGKRKHPIVTGTKKDCATLLEEFKNEFMDLSFADPFKNVPAKPLMEKSVKRDVEALPRLPQTLLDSINSNIKIQENSFRKRAVPFTHPCSPQLPRKKYVHRRPSTPQLGRPFVKKPVTTMSSSKQVRDNLSIKTSRTSSQVSDNLFINMFRQFLLHQSQCNKDSDDDKKSTFAEWKRRSQTEIKENDFPNNNAANSSNSAVRANKEFDDDVKQLDAAAVVQNI